MKNLWASKNWELWWILALWLSPRLTVLWRGYGKRNGKMRGRENHSAFALHLVLPEKFASSCSSPHAWRTERGFIQHCGKGILPPGEKLLLLGNFFFFVWIFNDDKNKLKFKMKFPLRKKNQVVLKTSCVLIILKIYLKINLINCLKQNLPALRKYQSSNFFSDKNHCSWMVFNRNTAAYFPAVSKGGWIPCSRLRTSYSCQKLGFPGYLLKPPEFIPWFVH